MTAWHYWAAALALCFAIGSSYRLDAEHPNTDQLVQADKADAIKQAKEQHHADAVR